MTWPTLRERRVVRTWAPVALAAAAVTLASFVVASGPEPTAAAWQSAKAVAVTATATATNAPSGLTCVASTGVLSGAIPFTWTAPAGATPSGYTLKWSGASTNSVSSTTTSGSVPAAALLGNLTIEVFADYGSWQSDAGTQKRTATVVVAGVLWGCS